MNPLQYKIYKGLYGKHGAIQFKFQPAHFYNGKVKDYEGKVDPTNVNPKAALTLEDNDSGGKSVRLKKGWNSRDGAIFMEITSAVGNNVYDWKNKIILALSITDLGQILYFLMAGHSEKGTGESLHIMHDPGAKSENANKVVKSLNMYSPNGTSKGCLVSVSKKTSKETIKHTVPVSGAELLVLRELIKAAIPHCLNW